MSGRPWMASCPNGHAPLDGFAMDLLVGDRPVRMWVTPREGSLVRVSHYATGYKLFDTEDGPQETLDEYVRTHGAERVLAHLAKPPIINL